MSVSPAELAAEFVDDSRFALVVPENDLVIIHKDLSVRPDDRRPTTDANERPKLKRMNWTRLKAQIAAVAEMLKEEHRRNTHEWIRRFEPSTPS